MLLLLLSVYITLSTFYIQYNIFQIHNTVIGSDEFPSFNYHHQYYSLPSVGSAALV